MVHLNSRAPLGWAEDILVQLHFFFVPILVPSLSFPSTGVNLKVSLLPKKHPAC